MSTLQKTGSFFLLLCTFLSLMSCNTDNGGVEPASGTIAEIVANSPNLSMLQSALVRTGLDADLDASGSMTLLAPTNTAFTLYLANSNLISINDIPVPDLRQLLLNHVLGARVDATLLRTLGKNYTETLADGPAANTNLALFFNATGQNIIFNGNAIVEDADIPATNGLVHIVDNVIDLPTLYTFVQSNDAFSELNTALTTATPGTNFMNTLSGSTTLTLFAPSNQAIDDWLDTNSAWTTVIDIEEGYLTAVLQHHLINGNVRSSDITNGETATSLEGDLLTFSTANGGVDITDGSGNTGISVVVGDIQATNGVLHAVEKVLLPDTSN